MILTIKIDYPSIGIDKKSIVHLHICKFYNSLKEIIIKQIFKLLLQKLCKKKWMKN